MFVSDSTSPAHSRQSSTCSATSIYTEHSKLLNPDGIVEFKDQWSCREPLGLLGPVSLVLIIKLRLVETFDDWYIMIIVFYHSYFTTHHIAELEWCLLYIEIVINWFRLVQILVVLILYRSQVQWYSWINNSLQPHSIYKEHHIAQLVRALDHYHHDFAVPDVLGSNSSVVIIIFYFILFSNTISHLSLGSGTHGIFVPWLPPPGLPDSILIVLRKVLLRACKRGVPAHHEINSTSSVQMFPVCSVWNMHLCDCEEAQVWILVWWCMEYAYPFFFFCTSHLIVTGHLMAFLIFHLSYIFSNVC